MLIIGADTGPVTSLFLIVPAPKTKDTAPASTCRMTVIADSIVRGPPRDAMQIVIGNVISAEEIKLVRTALKRARFVNGAATAGFAARLVKSNRQADGSVRSLDTIRKLVTERVLGNEVFRLAVRPKALSPLIFSRYDKGMHYGNHVDDALMDGMRTDVSFTLFLSEPESYDGGELTIESASGEETFKLDAGELVAYSATSLHRVGEVTRSRSHSPIYCACGWKIEGGSGRSH